MSINPTVRRVNLTYALLDADGPRSFEWVKGHVDGYRDLNDKTLRRDVALLREVGVPVRVDDGCVEVLKERYPLPEIELSAEEATVIALASAQAREGALGETAASGWTKLAASGAQRHAERGAAPSFTAENDLNRLDVDFLARLMRAVDRRRRVHVDYASSPTAPPQVRTLDPLGIVPVDGRLYVVGYDVEREAMRSFRALRLSRLRAVRDEKTGASVPATHDAAGIDLAGVVRKALRAHEERVAATVRFPGRTGEDLLVAARAMAEEAGADPTTIGLGAVDGDSVRIADVDADALSRFAAAYAPAILVEAPDSVHRRVLALIAGGQP